jgi:hypothetical protein
MNWGRKKFDRRSLRERKEKQEAASCCVAREGEREDVRRCVLAVGVGGVQQTSACFKISPFRDWPFFLSLVCL